MGHNMYNKKEQASNGQNPSKRGVATIYKDWKTVTVLF